MEGKILVDLESMAIRRMCVYNVFLNYCALSNTSLNLRLLTLASKTNLYLTHKCLQNLDVFKVITVR